MIHRMLRQNTFRDPRTETIWLTVYADLMTNLVLVFLVLYGLTVMGSGALRKATDSLNFKKVDFSTAGSGELSFEAVAPALRLAFQHPLDMTVSEKVGAVRLRFGEAILFRSGGAQVKETAPAVIKKVAAILKRVPYTVVVEGHTDSVPLGSHALYKNNWELSLARAMVITRLLIEKGGLSPDHIAAAAYGEQRPRADNLTPGGRRLNRRVEIALFHDFAYSIPKEKI